MEKATILIADAKRKLAEARKLIAYVVSVATSLVALGVLPSGAAEKVAVAVAVLGAVGLYKVPNAPRRGTE